MQALAQFSSLGLGQSVASWGKGRKLKTRQKNIWKKRSIFWDLPYWEHLEVRHCIDVMHVEKNVCDSLIGLLLNISGKTKDGVNARRDLVAGLLHDGGED